MVISASHFADLLRPGLRRIFSQVRVVFDPAWLRMYAREYATAMWLRHRQAVEMHSCPNPNCPGPLGHRGDCSTDL